MARLWSSGFELNSVTAGVEWTTIHDTPVVQGTTFRSGVYALQITSLTSATAMGLQHTFAAAAGNGPYFFRTYFRVATLPSAENMIIAVNNSADLTAPVVYLTLDNAGTLKLYDEDGQITGTATLSVDTWYNIEVKIDRTPAAGSQVVEARVDGAAAFATSSTRSLSAGVMVISLGGNLASEAQTTGNWYFDDVAVNDSTGSFQTSYPGTGEVVFIRPNGDGDTVNWTNTYTNIDEVTPDDATTTISSTTLNQIEEANLEATPAALASNDTINVVQVGARIRTSLNNPNWNGTKLRIKASAGGTVEESAEILIGTGYRTNANVVPYNYALTLYDMPGASSTAWTKADLDTAQIGVELSSKPSTATSLVSTLWLLIDHQPAAGTTTSTSSSTSTSTTSTSTSSSTSTTSTSTSSSSSSSTSTSTTSTSSSTSTSTTTTLASDYLPNMQVYKVIEKKTGLAIPIQTHRLSTWGTANRPAGILGEFGGNTTTGQLEWYTGNAWKSALDTGGGTITGDLTVQGDLTPTGRLMVPMGEVSYFSTTGTAVVIAAQSDGSTNMVVAAPTTTLNNDLEFDNGGANNGRLRYIGATTKTFHAACTISISPAAANDVFVFGVAKNGIVIAASKVLLQAINANQARSTAMHVMVSLATNDYLELYVGNITDADDCTILSLNLFAMGM